LKKEKDDFSKSLFSVDESSEAKDDVENIEEEEKRKEDLERRKREFRELVERERIARRKMRELIPSTEIVDEVEVKISARKRKMLMCFKKIDMIKKDENWGELYDALNDKSRFENSPFSPINSSPSTSKSKHARIFSSVSIPSGISDNIHSPYSTLPRFSSVNVDDEMPSSPPSTKSSLRYTPLSDADKLLIMSFPRSMSPSLSV
jgi:hypothetical protein